MSYHKLSTNSLNDSVKVLLKRGAHLGLGLGAFTPILALANPTGGQVMAGAATISNPNANHTVVKQASQSAIIDWQQFNIGTGQFVQFLQPSSSSIILNRVIGGGGSTILGSLTGNGQVFLINTNGVFFGRGATIDTQGFLASTLDIADSDFMSGNFNFQKSGSDAGIVNQGKIIAHNGGYVVLAGDYANNAGIISAQSGHVVLASGAKSILTLNGNGLVNYAVDQATLSALAGVSNSGKVVADGGTVVMTADVANLLKATVVNNTGLIEAHSMSKSDSGVISLTATGGNIVNAGTLDVSGTRMGTKGGDITLKTDQNTILTDKSRIFAAGVDADGGSVEVSGNKVAVRGALTIGKGGNFLLDPNQVEIVGGASTNFSSGSGKGTGSGENFNIGVNFIETQLNDGAHVTISAHNLINAASSVTKITAVTGSHAGSGVLHLKTATFGAVELHGVTIDIAGGLSGSMGYGNFGQITAGHVNLDISGSATFAAATVNSKGVIKQNSVTTTAGNLNINTQHINLATDNSKSVLSLVAAGNLDANAAVNITGNLNAKASNGYASFGNITATQGNATVTASTNLEMRNITAGGVITLAASSNNLVNFATGNTVVNGGHGINISGGHVWHSFGGDLSFVAAYGGITFGGGIGFDSGEGINGNVTIEANQAAVKLGKSAFVNGDLNIQGGTLAYTGGGSSFTLEDRGGNLTLDASIGTLKTPANYTVNLTNTGGDVFVERSIFVGNHDINITHNSSGAAFFQRIHVGDSGSQAPVTLSAKGDISLNAGGNGIVDIGSDRAGFSNTSGNHSFADFSGKVSILAGGDINIDGADVVVRANQAISFISGAAVDNSILIQAGGDLGIDGEQGVTLQAGNVIAAVSHGNANLAANLTLSAGGDMQISGSSVRIGAGAANASLEPFINGKHTVTASANLSLSAGSDVTIEGQRVTTSYGYGRIFAAEGKNANDTLTASATFSIKAGGDLNILAGGGVSDAAVIGARHLGGSRSGSGSVVVASGSHALVNATVHTDMTLTAGGSINISGHQVSVFSDQVVTTGDVINANGNGAVANLTATGLMTLKAGTAGIKLTAVGSDSTTPMLVHVGGGASHHAIGSGSTPSTNMAGRMSVAALNKGAANVSITNGVSISTKGDLTVVGRNAAIISAGASPFHITSFGNAVGASGQVTARTGGTAGLTVNSGITISAQDVTLSAGLALFGAGRDAGLGDVVTADNGTATVTISDGVKVTTTGDITLVMNMNHGLPVFFGGSTSPATVVNALGILAGDSAGAVASVNAAHGGKASLTVNQGVTLTAGGDVDMLASANSVIHNGGVAVQGGNNAGGALSFSGNIFPTKVTTGVGGGTAALTVSAAANVTAGGSILFLAGSTSSGGGIAGNAQIQAGGQAGVFATIAAAHAGGKAVLNATTGVSLTAQGGRLQINGLKVDMVGASYGGLQTETSAHGAGAVGSLNINGAINLNAKTSVDVSGSQVQAGAGRGLGAAGITVASGAGAKVMVNGDTSLNVTAKNISMGGAFFALGGGSGVDSSALNFAEQGGHVTAKLNASTNLTAKGSIELGASSFRVGAGSGGGGSYSASRHGVLKVTADESVNVQAGKTLSLGAVSMEVHGGNFAGASIIGVNGGSANLALNQSVNLTGGTSVTLAAFGDIVVVGGSGHFLAADAFLRNAAKGLVHYTAGKTAGSIDGAVTIKSGGDVNFVGIGSSGAEASSIVIAAGRGQQVQVGASISAAGPAWQGGTATLSVNSGVSVTAGGSMTLRANNDITVAGMYGVATSHSFIFNQANVNGGSSHAVAKLSLLGNAVLSAGHDIDIKAGGNVSVFGGSLANARADHADGNVTITGSANATVHAGADINLQGIGGSLTVAGVNVNSSHSGEILADAHADQGVATVTVHADASLSAVGNITGTDTGGIAGNLNVVAGTVVRGVTIGAATNEHALATANASITAGGSINLSVGGDLNVMGGNEGSVDLAATGSEAHQVRSASMQAKGAITAGTTLTLSVLGNGEILAGDSLGVVASHLNSGANATGSADVGATIKGGTVDITVAGNFLMRAGASDFASASAQAGLVKAKVTANANAVISATKDLNLVTGTAPETSASPLNSASYIGGNLSKANAFALGSDDQATATMNANVQVTAGKALLVVSNGTLTVAAGPGAESGGLVLAGASASFTSNGRPLQATNAVATANVNSGVSFTAGTDLLVGGFAGVNINGGSHAGSSAFIQAIGSNAKATLTVNDSVLFHAKGSVGLVTASGGIHLTAHHPVAVTSSGAAIGAASATTSNGRGGSASNNHATAAINSSITISGSAITASISPPVGSGSYVHDGVTVNATVNIIGPPGPISISPRSVTPDVRVQSGHMAAMPTLTVSSFGGEQPLSSLPTTTLLAPSLTVPATSLPAQSKPVQTTSDLFDLSTLQNDSLIISLETVIGPAQTQTPVEFKLGDIGTATFPDTCKVSLVSDSGHQSCRGGGR